MTTKRIVLIIMCAMLLLTVIMMAVVIGRVALVFGPLLNPQDGTQPPETSTQVTTPSSEATIPSSEATAPPTNPATEPTTPPQPTDLPHTHEFTVLTKQVQATCTSAGYSIYRCTCGATEMRDYMDAAGHKYGPGQLVAPSCTEEGYTERKCTVCGNVDTQDIKAPTGHQYEQTEVKEVTCEEDGYAEFQCTACGDIKRENVVEATGHQMEIVDVVKATCTEDGYTVYQCMFCDDLVQDDPVPAAGHSFGPWEVTTEPAAGNPGKEKRVCSACLQTEERECEITTDVRKSEPSSCWHYMVKALAKNKQSEDVTVYTYEVYDYGRFANMKFTYDPASGMSLSFTDARNQKKTYRLTDAETLYIDPNGEPGAPRDISQTETDGPDSGNPNAGN